MFKPCVTKRALTLPCTGVTGVTGVTAAPTLFMIFALGGTTPAWT